ncbi:hypothetical protein DLREEDagr8_36730 [Dongia sp. agr-C8]
MRAYEMKGPILHLNWLLLSCLRLWAFDAINPVMKPGKGFIERNADASLGVALRFGILASALLFPDERLPPDGFLDLLKLPKFLEHGIEAGAFVPVLLRHFLGSRADLSTLEL